ncbi:MAG: hypothetical protein JW712_01620 [Dehalococcoidales bacterium]|nr:hypothetical protein [Dehalococcoidales bacterium]
MAELKYAKNIITETREYSPEEMKKIEEMIAESPFESTVEGLRLLWMDDEKVEGAEMYMECLWLYEGVTTSGTTEEPHHHDFSEVIGFISTDQDNPGELDARMEIILGDETHYLTKSCLVHVPPGMKHCPLTFREVNRPVFFFTLAPISHYGRTSESVELKEGQSKEAYFPKPEPDESGTSYGRFIITRPKPYWDPENPPPPPPSGPNPAKANQIVSLDDEASPGAFYTDFVWIWSGNTVMSPESHSHDFDEMIGIVGFCGKDDPRKVDGDVSIMLGDEKHRITQSSLIYIPKGLKHCPIVFNDIRQPVLVFTIGNTPMFGSNKS